MFQETVEWMYWKAIEGSVVLKYYKTQPSGKTRKVQKTSTHWIRVKIYAGKV